MKFESKCVRRGQQTGADGALRWWQLVGCPRSHPLGVGSWRPSAVNCRSINLVHWVAVIVLIVPWEQLSPEVDRHPGEGPEASADKHVPENKAVDYKITAFLSSSTFGTKWILQMAPTGIGDPNPKRKYRALENLGLGQSIHRKMVSMKLGAM